MPTIESKAFSARQNNDICSMWQRRLALMLNIDVASANLAQGTVEFRVLDADLSFFMRIGADRIEGCGSCESPDARASLPLAAFESLLTGQTDSFSLFIREELLLDIQNREWKFEQFQRLVFFLVSDWKITPNAIADLERYASAIGAPTEVTRVDDIDPIRFDTHYAQRSRPLLLRKATQRWPLSQLNSSRLAALCGEERIGIFAPDFDAHPYWQTLSYRPQAREAFGRSYFSVLLSEYLEYCDQPGAPSTERSYLTANTAPDRVCELMSAPPYLQSSSYGSPRVWIGPAGTHTPLHRDLVDNFLAQIWGRKRVRLFSPSASSLLYPAGSVGNPYFERSCVDIRAPDLKNYPRFADARCIECMIEPGEMLFIPAGWWHSVDSFDASMSVNFFATLAAPRALNAVPIHEISDDIPESLNA